MRERWIVVSRERDLRRNGIYFRHLELITSERALSEHNLKVEDPVLIGSRENCGEILFYSKAGQVLEAPQFSPRRRQGIYFEHTHAGVLTHSSETAFKIQEKSWVAFLDAIGGVYTRDESRVIDYRLAKSVRINSIEAHCQFCAEDNFLNIPISKINRPYHPLKTGFVFDKHPGLNGQGILGGTLGAVCDVEKHVKERPWIEYAIRYRFQISEDGEFTTSKL